MMLAIIGGDPKRFVPFADLYRRALKEMGKTGLPVGVHSHGYVAEPTRRRARRLFADYKRMRDKIGAERGWPPMSRADFEREIEHGSLYVGSPETVARKIAGTVQAARSCSLHHEVQRRSAAARKGRCAASNCYGRKVMPAGAGDAGGPSRSSRGSAQAASFLGQSAGSPLCAFHAELRRTSDVNPSKPCA
jgi:hypothetical protein